MSIPFPAKPNPPRVQPPDCPTEIMGKIELHRQSEVVDAELDEALEWHCPNPGILKDLQTQKRSVTHDDPSRMP